MTVFVPALLALLACGGADDPEPGPDAPIDDDPTTDSGTVDTPDTPSPTTPTAETGLTITGLPTGSTGSTGGTGNTGATADTAAVIDCAITPPLVTAASLVPGARGYHGLVFTDAGELVGSDGNSLVAVDRYGGFRVILPGTGNLEQLDRLADGTIIAGGTSDGQVVAIDPTTGALTPLAPISGVYGVRVGPDQKIYVADWDAIYRIDPTTGLVETWLDNNAYNPKVLDFSHDLSKLYFGTISQSGNVYSVDLDANYDPVAPPVLLASTPGSWHDGLTVDICGNLYIAEYNNAAMYVVTPSGNVSTLFDAGGAGSSNYGHGVVFGTGANGWYEDAIYFPQPYNNDTVGEAIVGLPHRSYTGPVINQP